MCCRACTRCWGRKAMTCPRRSSSIRRSRSATSRNCRRTAMPTRSSYRRSSSTRRRARSYAPPTCPRSASTSPPRRSATRPSASTISTVCSKRFVCSDHWGIHASHSWATTFLTTWSTALASVRRRSSKLRKRTGTTMVTRRSSARTSMASRCRKATLPPNWWPNCCHCRICRPPSAPKRTKWRSQWSRNCASNGCGFPRISPSSDSTTPTSRRWPT